MKKSISAILLALTLVLAFGMSAFAKPTYTASELSFSAPELECRYTSNPPPHNYYILPSVPDAVYRYAVKESDAPSTVITTDGIGNLCTDQERNNVLTSDPVVGTPYYFRITWRLYYQYSGMYNIDFGKLSLSDCTGTIPGYHIEAVEKEKVGNERIKVVYKIIKLPADNYGIYALNGTADKLYAAAGDTVTVTADEPVGYRFKNWEVVSGTVSFQNAADIQTTFTMASSDVKVKAVYENPLAVVTAKTVAVNLAADDMTEAQAKAIAEKEIASPLDGTAVYYGKSGNEYLAITYNGSDWVTGTAETLSAIRAQDSLDNVFVIGEIEEATAPLVKIAKGITNGTAAVSEVYPIVGDTVTVTATPELGYKAAAVTATDKNGNAITVTDNTFIMPEAAKQPVTVNVNFVISNPFVDVAETDYFYAAAALSAANGITNGVDDTHFAPRALATRVQFLTMLWRAAGCPEVTYGTTFVDVNHYAYYYQALQWAVKNKIAYGDDKFHFVPERSVTRAEAVTMLWRAEGSPEVRCDIKFKDIPAESWYTEAVRWAIAKGIACGTSADAFSPAAFANRAQAVTFLYRNMDKYSMYY